MPEPVPCRRACALACPATAWAWVLDDASPAPPAWRVAWSLVGLPTPLDPSEWPAMLKAARDCYGLAEVRRGLRLAADQPPLSGGWTNERRGRVVALLDRLAGDELRGVA